jgi:hypothetical protein
MAQERFPNNDTKQHESLCDLHLSSLWSVSGSDWSANIREGCLGATNQPVEKEPSKLRRNLLALGALGALALVGAASLTPGSQTSQALQNYLAIRSAK